MKIYFAGAIRGGRGDRDLYAQIIEELQKYGTVLTEHVGNAELTAHGEADRTDADIYERDMEWIRAADVVVAEVTTPSLGVGYELGQAEAMGKKIICLYREQDGKRLSAMVSGSAYPKVRMYKNRKDVVEILNKELT